ncbi:phosphoribosylanthranilate isomerase [Devosia sp. MC521]|uniref:phosphoribosylanthranilate isomerase n=1 Tax=Devosia sp. MC521 TaxID=2759954 RepID=UPI0015F8520C|nr:phosphoribosylanthranilate isomerase [Devosia sp. MC521]MBJ6986792.1 phosphoribosylanthranilate isomerase [Devosia sp. MC521]QMW63827.1 phosphoribosylanthranilate isomerase [Devosia sp. MC521]
MAELPSFIAFTGLDNPAQIGDLRELSARYPIEWGVLVDDAQTEKPLFPDAEKRKAFVTAGGLRLAAHVCGEQARRIANEPDSVDVELFGYSRVQVNHSFTGSSAAHIENTVYFGRKIGVRSMLQFSKETPSDSRLDWLFDVSFGTGVAPTAWPTLAKNGPFVGFSGGIGPDTVKDVLKAIDAPQGVQYWIDMESRIRTDGYLDLNKCEAVCRAVYG